LQCRREIDKVDKIVIDILPSGMAEEQSYWTRADARGGYSADEAIRWSEASVTISRLLTDIESQSTAQPLQACLIASKDAPLSADYESYAMHYCCAFPSESGSAISDLAIDSPHAHPCYTLFGSWQGDRLAW